MLRSLGHKVALEETYRGGAADLLVALHAHKSAGAVAEFLAKRPGTPVVVALTGTDLYEDLPGSEDARQTLAAAWRLIVLQPLAIAALPDAERAKARVIFQSVPSPRHRALPEADTFDVCVLGYLRDVKDPMRAALAARLLSPTSKLRILHVGAALDEEWEKRARTEQAENPRYRWLGGLPRTKALEVLGKSRLLVHSSKHEGGANAISEAVVASVPVLATRIPGSVGLLGEEYRGYFPVGDTAALATLLGRAEHEPAFYAAIARACAARRPLFDPARERESWRRLLDELPEQPR
jgi:putative glycosyltransferase (TIGR04348 family)